MKIKISLQLCGIISYALTQWLLMLYFAHIHDLNIAAKYIYYLAILTPLSIFFSYGLRNGVASDKDNRYSFKNYLNISYMGGIIYLIVSIIILYLISDVNIYLFSFTILLKLSELISEPYYGNFLRNGLSEKYALSRIYKLILGIVVFSFFYLIEFYFKIEFISLFGYLISVYIVFFFFDKHKSYIKEPSLGDNRGVSLIRYNLPLALSALIVALNGSIPKIVFGFESQSIGLAVFGFLIYMNSIAVLPIAALIQIAYGKKEIKYSFNIIKYLTIYSLIYFILFLCFAPFILKHIFNVNYGYDFYSLILTGLLAIFQFYLTVNNFYLTYNRKFRYILFLSLSALILNIFLCFIFVDFGLNGILLSVLISTLIACFLGNYLRVKDFK